jgi:hypothetical protein
MTERVNVSEMSPGDIGYLPMQGELVQLKTGGKSGGCEYDRYLAHYEGTREEWDNAPVVVLDTEEISL